MVCTVALRLWQASLPWVVCLALAAIAGMVGGCGDGGPANHTPTITALSATPNTVAPGGQSQIHCTAQDQDGDALNYAWTCGAGQITGTGATVTWTAPATEGECTVTCTVSDGKPNGCVTQSVAVHVAALIDPNDPTGLWDLGTIEFAGTCTESDYPLEGAAAKANPSEAATNPWDAGLASAQLELSGDETSGTANLTGVWMAWTPFATPEPDQEAVTGTYQADAGSLQVTLTRIAESWISWDEIQITMQLTREGNGLSGTAELSASGWSEGATQVYFYEVNALADVYGTRATSG